MPETIIKNKIDKKITFPRWPSEFPANLCRPVCLYGLAGRHWLADNSEGHCGISKFLFLMVPYNYDGDLATGIREVAFFYHLKTQSYIVYHHAPFKPNGGAHLKVYNYQCKLLQYVIANLPMSTK